MNRLYRVALLSGLAGHEPTLVRLWPAELTGARVVCVYPSAIADDVAAVAVGLAAVCVNFLWCVHLVSPRVGPLAPASPCGPSRAAPCGVVGCSPYLPQLLRVCIYSANQGPFWHGTVPHLTGVYPVISRAPVVQVMAWSRRILENAHCVASY